LLAGARREGGGIGRDLSLSLQSDPGPLVLSCRGRDKCPDSPRLSCFRYSDGQGRYRRAAQFAQGEAATPTGEWPGEGGRVGLAPWASTGHRALSTAEDGVVLARHASQADTACALWGKEPGDDFIRKLNFSPGTSTARARGLGLASVLAAMASHDLLGNMRLALVWHFTWLWRPSVPRGELDRRHRPLPAR
jgi:hypothetical protein